MRCPQCGSSNHAQKRGPVEQDGILLRRHICSDCGRMFVSAQLVLENEPLIEKLLEEVEL